MNEFVRLYLCEKPSQARDIARELGETRDKKTHIDCGSAVVTFAIGHLLAQVDPEGYDPSLKRWDITSLPIVPEKWKTAIKNSGKAQMKVIKDLLGKANEVVVATDADREGEMIAREILEYARYRGPVSRLWLSALDPESIRKALKKLKPGVETESLYHAALARSRADWLVGMNMTRASTLVAQASGVKGVVSVGRVQTPTLALVVRRDREIEGFRPVDYFEVVAAVSSDGHSFPMRYSPGEEKRILKVEDARAIAAAATGSDGPLRVKDEVKREPPPKLFSLSALQSAASARWGWAADKTLEVAQKLYEAYKLTTYPRTDCCFLPEEQEGDTQMIYANLRATILNHLPDVRPTIRKTVFNNSKITAHHAIIPTKARAKDSLDPDAAKLYRLIGASYAAALLPDYEYRSVKGELDAGGVTFTAKGNTPLKPGWKIAFHGGNVADGDAADTKLPPLKDGALAHVDSAEVESKRTKPPSRFTEGTLIEAMKSVAKYVENPAKKAKLKETSGIGTEATRAAIIKTIRTRGFVESQGKFLISTAKGRDLIAWLEKSLPSLADPGETAVWEDGLEEVESGKQSVDTFTLSIATRIGEYINVARGALPETHNMAAANSQMTPTEEKCPKSGEPVMEGQTIFTLPGFPGVRFAKEICSRQMSAADWVSVLSGEKKILSGFVSRKNGRKFDAALVWNDAKERAEFDFGDSGSGKASAPDPARQLAVKCPKSGKPAEDRGNYFAFPGYPGLRAWKEVSGRAMSAQEYAAILGGSPFALDGFTSKAGKKFDAKMVYDKTTNRISFDFGKKAA